ncbi:hypothetical protein NDU88_002595 [Pleurodeles waltl]|uniref:Uncharacterized protein n=1 Tax=Pleurodeles waltl TaxID=8319 RepID=A0AAV7UXT5_PLEWA|nr:hypothetical protein NDU88_002595 [Pleurodeles waltl]
MSDPRREREPRALPADVARPPLTESGPGAAGEEEGREALCEAERCPGRTRHRSSLFSPQGPGSSCRWICWGGELALDLSRGHVDERRACLG